jgi:hypothetical protein
MSAVRTLRANIMISAFRSETADEVRDMSGDISISRTCNDESFLLHQLTKPKTVTNAQRPTRHGTIS